MNSGFLERFGKVFAPVVFDMNRNIDVSNKFCELYAKGILEKKIEEMIMYHWDAMKNHLIRNKIEGLFPPLSPNNP